MAQNLDKTGCSDNCEKSSVWLSVFCFFVVFVLKNGKEKMLLQKLLRRNKGINRVGNTKALIMRYQLVLSRKYSMPNVKLKLTEQ